MDASLYRSSRSGRPRLRIGLLLESASLPRWSAEILDHIIGCDFAAIELVVYDAGKARTTHSSFLFRLYERWDRRNVDPSTSPDARVDCSERLAQVDSMRVDTIAEGCAHSFADEAVARIRDRKLDVLIHFGCNDLRGEVLGAARYGVWSYHHGDSAQYRGAPAYFWEIVEENPVSGAVLQVLTQEPGAGKVLCGGLFATDDGFSLARNRVQPFWGASTFMIQKLRELHAHGWEHVERNLVSPAPYRGRKVHSRPSNTEVLLWLVPLLVGKTVRRLFRRPMVRHWRIAIRVGARPIPGSTAPPDMSGFRWIDPPKGHAYADPFVIEVDGKHWAYFEDFDYASERGSIACAEIRDGALGAPMHALERPYHISYPCIFRDGETWYMIPETAAAGTVELYRCARFPDRWQFERELLKAFVVDTTVWIENGVYWFFVTYLEPRGGALQLWLYSATSLEGAWTPHPANPISTDVRCSRSAGAIFRHEGRLYRPSQDDSGDYGRSMTLNEIVVMDRESYREEPRVTVEPSLIKGLAGTHTYGRAGDVEIIDGKTRVMRRRIL